MCLCVGVIKGNLYSGNLIHRVTSEPPRGCYREISLTSGCLLNTLPRYFERIGGLGETRACLCLALGPIQKEPELCSQLDADLNPGSPTSQAEAVEFL